MAPVRLAEPPMIDPPTLVLPRIVSAWIEPEYSPLLPMIDPPILMLPMLDSDLIWPCNGKK